MPAAVEGQLVSVGDTRLHVVERGTGYPVIVLHGGPGLDHRMFGDYLDPLDGRVPARARRPARAGPLGAAAAGDLDARADGRRRVRARRVARARALRRARPLVRRDRGAAERGRLPRRRGADDRLERRARRARYLADVDANLAAFEPVELREQVTRVVGAGEATCRPRRTAPPAAATSSRSTSATRSTRASRTSSAAPPAASTRPRCCGASPTTSTAGSRSRTGSATVTQPVLVLAGRHDRTCVVGGCGGDRRRYPAARELVVFEHSGHMTFVEENDRYLETVRAFLQRTR